MKNVPNVFPINIVVNMRDWTIGPGACLCVILAGRLEDNNNSSGDENLPCLALLGNSLHLFVCWQPVMSFITRCWWRWCTKFSLSSGQNQQISANSGTSEMNKSHHRPYYQSVFSGFPSTVSPNKGRF